MDNGINLCVGEEGHVLTFLGWFWIRVHNIGHLGLGAKLGQKTKIGLKWQLAYFGAKVGSLATFLKISTSNLFCFSFTLRLIDKPNKKSIGPKIRVFPKSCNFGYN